MARKSNTGIPGLSFSWKRALGMTTAKRKVARATGIPTTANGRRAKAARMSGCLIPTLLMLGIPILILMLIL